jgi:hypothetical protein
MFRWYQESKVCYVFLVDVDLCNSTWNGDEDAGSEEHTLEQANLENQRSEKTWFSKFTKSRWFTRGWTLQELLAPKRVIFFDTHWTPIGTRKSIASRLSSITGIDIEIIRDPFSQMKHACVAQRLSWASRRQTSRKEDIAYCLLGIFGVNMPLLYGEGDRAFTRLQEEIMKLSSDHSIFAWDLDKDTVHTLSQFQEDGVETSLPLLASSPRQFTSCGKIKFDGLGLYPKAFTMTNAGLQITLPRVPLVAHRSFGSVALLSCSVERPEKSRDVDQNGRKYLIGIWLMPLSSGWVRLRSSRRIGHDLGSASGIFKLEDLFHAKPESFIIKIARNGGPNSGINTLDPRYPHHCVSLEISSTALGRFQYELGSPITVLPSRLELNVRSRIESLLWLQRDQTLHFEEWWTVIIQNLRTPLGNFVILTLLECAVNLYDSDLAAMIWLLPSPVTPGYLWSRLDWEEWAKSQGINNKSEGFQSYKQDTWVCLTEDKPAGWPKIAIRAKFEEASIHCHEYYRLTWEMKDLGLVD